MAFYNIAQCAEAVTYQQMIDNAVQILVRLDLAGILIGIVPDDRAGTVFKGIAKGAQPPRAQS